MGCRFRVIVAVFGLLLCGAFLLYAGFWAHPALAAAPASDSRLKHGYRFDRDGWVYVHLEGSPSEMGFQHGYLLAQEIADAIRAIALQNQHLTDHDWEFYRTASREMLWPHIDPEYQQELDGISEGLQARGENYDVWDVVALNAMQELPGYYVPWLNRRNRQPNPSLAAAGEHCSAFVATGSYTKDHQIVIAHNDWDTYLSGERQRIIFDLVPARGFRILMDGFPGVIASDDDFGINSAGLMITETTISGFFGWDPDGKPEFLRARKALEYAGSIDDYVRIMNEGNNGGYANDWLLGDRKTGEIARFEQGLKHTRVWRTRDGYFEGSNFASDPEVLREETNFNAEDLSKSPNARRLRWQQLMQENRGKIDATLGERFLADHYDTFEKKEQPNERTLCGHVDLSPRVVKSWSQYAYAPAGAVIGKVADSAMAERMTMAARFGHPCGGDFKAQSFLAQHPEYAWEAPALHDMDAGPWSTFSIGQKK